MSASLVKQRRGSIQIMLLTALLGVAMIWLGMSVFRDYNLPATQREFSKASDVVLLVLSIVGTSLSIASFTMGAINYAKLTDRTMFPGASASTPEATSGDDQKQQQ